MSESGRKYFRLIIGVIWIAGGIICGISGQIITSLLFLAVGVLFILRGRNTENKE